MGIETGPATGTSNNVGTTRPKELLQFDFCVAGSVVPEKNRCDFFLERERGIEWKWNGKKFQESNVNVNVNAKLSNRMEMEWKKIH